MTKSLKIYIGGDIYGAGNIGDDAILHGILKIINDKNHDFTIGTFKGTKLINLKYKNIRFIDALNLKNVKKAIKNSDIFICGGGTMIGDELGLSFPVQYVAHLISLAKFYRKKVFLCSIGANKLKSDKAKRIVKNIYNLADLISVRDPESLKVCKDLGINKNKLIESADPAFLLNKKETKRTKIIKKEISAKNKNIFGVNVVNECWKHIKDYKKNIAKACNYIYKKYGYRPVFFCNEIREGNNFDYEANKEVIKYLNCEYKLLKPIYYAPQEMIDIISSFKFTIGMRMHALIFSAIANVPIIAISRIDKVNNFTNQFNLKISGNINNLDPAQLIKDIENTINNINNTGTNFSKKIHKLKKTAKINNNLFENLKDKKMLLPKFNLISLKIVFCKKIKLNIKLIKRLIKKILLR